jgi:hypothetical protein
VNRTLHHQQESADVLAELASRETHGLEVTLLWDKRDERLVVVVDDARTGTSFALLARDGKEALDAFYHPFAYAAAHGVVQPSRDLPVAPARIAPCGRPAQ